MTDSHRAYYAFSVAFRIHGPTKNFSPELAAIGLLQTKLFLSGDHIISEIVDKWPRDLWVFESLLENEADLSDQLLNLWRQLRPHCDVIKSLVKKGIDMDIYCGFVTDTCTGGFSISPEAIEMIVELGVPLEVSVTLR